MVILVVALHRWNQYETKGNKSKGTEDPIRPEDFGDIHPVRM